MIINVYNKPGVGDSFTILLKFFLQRLKLFHFFVSREKAKNISFFFFLSAVFRLSLSLQVVVFYRISSSLRLLVGSTVSSPSTNAAPPLSEGRLFSPRRLLKGFYIYVLKECALIFFGNVSLLFALTG